MGCTKCKTSFQEIVVRACVSDFLHTQWEKRAFFLVGLANFPTLQKTNHKTGRKTVDTTTDNNDTLPYIFRSVGKCATKACTIFKWATFVSKNSKWLCLSRVSDFAKNFLAVFCGFEFSIQK